MKSLIVRIDLENDALLDPNSHTGLDTFEIADLLEYAGNGIANGFEAGNLYDSNGNRVGYFSITESAK